MAEDRVRIILKEIHHWKEHRLLPEVYCDFLIALYTNGDGIEDDGKTNKHIPISIYISFIFLLSFLILSFVVIYFSELTIPLKFGLLILFWFLSFLLFLFIFNKQEHKRYHFLSLMAFLLLTLLGTVYIGSSFFDILYMPMIIIIINFIGWLILSVFFRYKWLIFISLLGIIFTFFYIVF